VSTFAAHATGSLLRTTPAGWAVHDGVDVPFRVLVGKP
jgi:hypothetical protein